MVGKREAVVIVNFHDFSELMCEHYGHENTTHFELVGGPRNQTELIRPEPLQVSEYNEIYEAIGEEPPSGSISSVVGIEHYYLRDMVCAAYMDEVVPNMKHVITDITT